MIEEATHKLDEAISEKKDDLLHEYRTPLDASHRQAFMREAAAAVPDVKCS